MIYLVLLMLAPQLWYEPIINMRVDLFLYPIWGVYLIVSGKIKNLKLDAQLIMLLFLIFWIFISMLVNGISLDYRDLFFKCVKYAVLFILISISFSSTKKLPIFFLCMVFLSIVLSIEGLDHYFSEDGLGWAGQSLGWVDHGAKGRTRWVGIFDGPGVFCVVYTISLPFVLIVFTQKNKLFSKIFAGLLTCLLFAAIFYNGSRGGLLTAIAVFGMLFGVDQIRKSKFKATLCVLAILCVLTLAPSHMTQVSDKHKSSSNRVDMWAEGVEMVQQNPVFGIGKGQFARYTGKLIAHNSAIEIMGEAGIIGLFAWIGLIYFSIIKLYFYIKQNLTTEENSSKLMAKALIVSVLGYLVSAMFVTLEYETFYMLLGLCAVFGRELEEPILLNRAHLKKILIITFSWLFFIKVFTLLVDPSSLS